MSRLRQDAGAVAAWVLFLGAALGAGAVTGVVLGATGVLDLSSEPTVIAAYDEASYFDCPGGAHLGLFARGDRVYLTGRSQAGDWVEVRAPFDTSQRVWMRGPQVTPDAVAELPVVVCPVGTVEETTSTTAATTDTTTATTDTTSGGTDTTATIATTVALPTVGSVSVTNDPIWEGYATDEPGGTCISNPGQPIHTVVSATVSAPAGVQSVVVQWAAAGQSGSQTMALSGGAYRVELDRFDAQDPNLVPPNQSVTVTLTVRVTDTLGRTATGQRTMTLNDCNLG